MKLITKPEPSIVAEMDGTIAAARCRFEVPVRFEITVREHQKLREECEHYKSLVQRDEPRKYRGIPVEVVKDD